MKISVDAEALRQLLQALSGPPHYIREIQVTRNIDGLLGEKKNPLNILVDEYNEWAKKTNEFTENPELMDHYQSMQEELKWVKDVIAERIGYDGPLGPAVCPLADWMDQHITYRDMFNKSLDTEAVLRQQIKFAREYAEKKGLEAATYLPKILQLSALLKRARVDVNYSFQMNADLERHQVFTPIETAGITEAADKYQDFLDEIDAALWVPPEVVPPEGSST